VPLVVAEEWPTPLGVQVVTLNGVVASVLETMVVT